MSVPSNVIKKTQDSLGKYVKKPPLTDKLLSKPPFRFLHDVISAVIKETGALQGLFNETESKSENVKDKEGKIKYLEKAIDCVSFAIGEPLGAKPSKIVSGQEPQKTNEFLQALAKIIDKKVDTSPFVERVLQGEKPGKSVKAVPSNNKSGGPYNAKNAANNAKNRAETNKKRDGSSSRKNSLTGSQASSSREQSKSRGNSKSPAKRVISRENSKEEPKQNGDEIVNGEGLQTVIEGHGENGINHEIEPPLTNGNHQHQQEKTDESSPPKTPPRPTEPPEPEKTPPSSAKEPTPPSSANQSTRRGRSSRERTGSSRPTTGYGKGRPNNEEQPPGPSELKNEDPKPDENAPQQRPGSAVKSARPRTGRLKSARPPSARPAAPRLKERNEVAQEEFVQQRPQTGNVANVIVDDGTNKDEDDADEFLVEEKPKDNLDLDTENTSVDVNEMAIENGEHGALVQQILDTKKELEDNSVKKPGVEIEKDAGFSDFNRQREREATQRDVQKLKDSIQTLTRSANPLGKLMDFLQEDVDSMQRELETWRAENRKLQAQLRAEESLTQQSIEPLKVHLTELETAVQEQLDMISTVKSNVLKNDEKIARMVGSIGVAGK